MDKDQLKGILNACIHIIETEAPQASAKAIILALNSLPKENQADIGKRIIAYLKETENLLNQKP